MQNFRTPDDVFYDGTIRIPRREPDESFAYLFFDLVENGRVVGNNGVQVDGRIYRLVSLQKHLEYWGERVGVRVNPDDQRVAMIYDRRNGVYVCKALVDAEDATYDTRDEVTRNLIARVFSDGKHLLRMAKEFTEGAKERLADYKRAKIEYLTRRARENDSVRKERRASLVESPAVTVIGSLSGVAREDGQEHAELTARAIAEVLDADEAAASAAAPALCVVSTRQRKEKRTTGRRRHDGALRYTEIAKRLGTTSTSLDRYRNGITPWPEGMREKFEAFERLRETEASDATAEILPPVEPHARPRRTRGDGELSYANIAKALGMHLKMLERCRQGKREWPAGVKEKFESYERKRSSG